MEIIKMTDKEKIIAMVIAEIDYLAKIEKNLNENGKGRLKAFRDTLEFINSIDAQDEKGRGITITQIH